MLITITQLYAQGAALLDDEDFYEEVIAEAQADEFVFTCSLGVDDEGDFLNWNLFFGDFFSGSVTIPLHKCKFDVFNEAALTAEVTSQFRRMLMQAANGGDKDAKAAQQVLATLS